MGKYLINGSTYEIDESIQGDALNKTLTDLAATPADPRGAKIDKHLSETDTLLGLPPGTSARQINQESKFRDDAVSPVGARGLAQVMPATLQSLSARLGRKLDPHNTDDALTMHRELMRENIAKFGNPEDALRAYNAGWDKKKWANKETDGYLKTVMGVAPATTLASYPAAPKDVNPALLKDNQDWLRASRQIQGLRERKAFTGTDQDLAEWGKDLMGNFNSNIVAMTNYAHDLQANGTDADKMAFLFLMDTYDNTDFSWEGAGRAVQGIATDPTTYVGLGTLGIGTVGKVMASAAAKQGIKKMLLTSLGRTGIIAGAESAALGGFESTIRQGVEVTAGRRESVSAAKVAGDALLAGTAGVVLGTAGDAAITAITGVVRRGAASRAAGKAPAVAPGAPPVAPSVVPGTTPAAAVPAAPIAPPPEGRTVPIPVTQVSHADGLMADGGAQFLGKGEPFKMKDGTTGETVLLLGRWEDTAIMAIDSHGKPMGVLQFELAAGFQPDVRVVKEDRRRGVATAMYDHAERARGFPFDVENSVRTPDGVAFRESRAARAATSPVTLTSDEILAATARQQKGRLWTDDLAPVTPENPVVAGEIGIPQNPSGGMRATAQSLPELQANGDLVAAQLRGLPDNELHGALEHFRQTLTVDDAPILMKGVQILKNELVLERLALSKELPGATPERATEILSKLDALDVRTQPVILADDAMGSFSGSLLNQRKYGIPIPADFNVTDLVAKGMTRVEAEAEYGKVVAALQLEAANTAAAKEADIAIQAALDAADHQEAARLTVLKFREVDARVAIELPAAASWTQKANEFVISNIFTPTTLAINLIPAAAKTLMVPLAKAMVGNPLLATTRREMTASYSAMASTMGASLKAAWASLKYEQSILTRDNGRLVEGELALTGRLGGGIRFFPRLLNATDEFLAQMNYNSFVAGREAATALVEGQAKGLTGRDLDDYIKLSSKIAMEEAFTQKSGEAMLQPLVNKGVNLGYTGDKLWDYVTKEALKSPEALRHGSDDEALEFVRDVLYKRRFSGEGGMFGKPISGLAQSYEQAMMKAPGMKLVLGQLFFRTPIRVFEEGIRLTPGLQILAPNFINDLAGKNGTLAAARANAEALVSLSMVGGILSLYASGNITGDGAYDNWRQQRTGMDGPKPAPYTIKMADGSTWSYRNFDPIATPFKIIINGLERMDKLAIRQSQGEVVPQTAWDSALAHLTVGTSAIAAALRDANLMTGVDQALKLGENLADPEAKEGAWLKYFGEKLSLVVPNTLHKIAKTNDPTLKDPADFWQVVETRLAALHVDRAEVKTSYSYDVLGNVRQLTDSGTLWNIFSTASPEERQKGHTPEGTAVMIEVDRLQREVGATFTPPIKHAYTGEFDLRTVLTGDKSETLYDRWQRNYRELTPEKYLYPLISTELPDGTRKVKSARLEAVQETIKQLQDAAFMKTMGQEQRVIDEMIDLETGKAKAQGGLFDYGKRDK